jgi:AraC-like DNA-binding protein
MDMIYDELMHELGPKSNKLNAEAIAPAPGLQNLIDRYIVLTRQNPIMSNCKWYLLPDNRAYLIFYLFDLEKTMVPKWIIVGPRSKHKIISRQNRHFTFICSFKPGALNWFVDAPVSELRDKAVDASLLLNTKSTNFFEKLTMNALRFDILNFVKDFESLLTSSISTPPGSHYVAQEFYQYCLNSNAVQLFNNVSKNIGYSDRQLRTLVQNYIGQSPKMVAKIERFTKSLALIKNGESWTSIAYSTGYYDQSHMISDYNKLVGSTPGKLFS